MDSKKRTDRDDADGESGISGGMNPAAAEDVLTEDQSLALLKQGDFSAQEIERLVSTTVIKSRKVRLAAASHPRTPRRIALRLVRELYTFDLVRFTLAPAVAADLRRLAEDLLITRLPAVTLGERIALGRRSSQMVAAALLLDKDSRVWRAALENPRLAEPTIVKALQSTKASPGLVAAMCRHAKWSPRTEVRIALLRNPHTPLARAVDFARALLPGQLREVLHASRLPEKVKSYLRNDLGSRQRSAAHGI
jgi:hypothetical protein